MSDDKPFKMIPELQAGALNAWTPLQQAALYRQHAVLQADMDDKAEARKKRKDEADAVKRKVKPERVEAGEVMDQLMEDRMMPLYDFLNLFGPPHLAIAPFVLCHLAWWYIAPWYMHYWLTSPMTYIVPSVCTLQALFRSKHRELWLAYWIILALVSYAELLLFAGSVRGLIWWPRCKYLLCLLMQYTWKFKARWSESDNERKVMEQEFGAIFLIKPLLPDVVKEHKERE